VVRKGSMVDEQLGVGVHTYIHSYIHSYIHTYIHTSTRSISS
jgi:hypothetical protein